MEEKIVMSVEAYPVHYEKINFHAPIPDGLPVEEVKQIRRNTIKDNLVRYVGEYRLGVKFDEYYYTPVKDSHTGEEHFTAGGTQTIQDLISNTIKAREELGAGTKREVAEGVGFAKLEEELLEREVGTMAIWVSPPGSEDEGYGEYSFTFLAQSEMGESGKRVRMIPYRNEYTIEQHNEYLSKITKTDVAFQNDTQFLASPFIIEASGGIQSPEDILSEIGEKEEFENSWNEDFYYKARPLIQYFINLVELNASDEELIEAKCAIENYAIAYKEDREVELFSGEEKNLKNNAMDYGKSLAYGWGRIEPPKVKGSCPTGIMETNGAITGTSGDFLPSQFHNSSNLLPDRYGERTFNCPSCQRENVRPVETLLPNCLHCKKAIPRC